MLDLINIVGGWQSHARDEADDGRYAEKAAGHDANDCHSVAD
jgi:hypothetical protein